MPLVIFIEKIFNCSVVKDCNTSAVFDRCSSFYFFNINPIVFELGHYFSWAVSTQIPLPRAKPSVAYSVIYITKRMKILSAYFATAAELLCVVKGFSLVINYADVIRILAFCQSEVLLRVASA